MVSKRGEMTFNSSVHYAAGLGKVKDDEKTETRKEDQVSEIQSLSGIPSFSSRYASISRGKPSSRHCTPINELFEMICSDDNASVTSLPISFTGRNFHCSRSISKLSTISPQSLPSILEDNDDIFMFLEEYEEYCRQNDPIEVYYFLPSKSTNCASEKWAYIESTGKYDELCSNITTGGGKSAEAERTQPLCLKERGKDAGSDILWF